MNQLGMFELAQALAVAKSRQDVPAAMKVLHPDVVLEVPAFGSVVRGAAATERALGHFFASFPDYDVTLRGHTADGDTLTCWGTVRMTMTGDRFGVTPAGTRAELPVVIQFTFEDDRIASERFVFDLAELCAQSGVSTDVVRRKLFGGAETGIRTEPLFDIAVELDPPLDIGKGPLGRRILFGAAGGTFAGPELRGKVLTSGGDWALFRPDGVMALDVRLTLRTDDDQLVSMTYGGRWTVPAELRGALADPATRHKVDPARYYFRTTPLFETGSAKYAWLNDVVCVGSGSLVEGGIAYRVFRVA